MVESYKFDYLDWKSLFINPNHSAGQFLDDIRNMQSNIIKMKFI